MTRLVIADTGPINYLILIGHVDLLAVLFEKVALPTVVQAELSARNAPLPVRNWVANPPVWLEVHAISPDDFADESLEGIDEGERASIALASLLGADLLLIDDRKGVITARQRGFRVTGTLGILDLAARHGLLNFGQAVERLRRTNFRSPEALLDSLLKQHQKRIGCIQRKT